MTGRSISIRSTIFAERGFRITPGFWLLLAATLAACPGAVAAAVFLAALMHECGHAAALRAFRVPVDGMCLGGFGAVIYARGARRLSYGRELIVTLAGPAVNLFFGPLIAACAAKASWGWGYLFAGAHVLLGVYNLLPVLPLDGGRALYLATAWRWGPSVGDAVSAVSGLLCSLALCVLGLSVTVRFGGVFLLLAALGLLFGTVRQLGLAKRRVTV